MKSVRRARANIFDLQPLEIRRFLTTASIVGGQLQINGTASGETITVNQFNSTSVSVTGVSGSFLRANFSTISVNAGGGNDTILISSNLGTPSTTISGGNGNDFITGGGGADRISGDAGFDTANYSSRTSAIKVDLDGVADDGGNGGAEGDNVQTDEVIGGSGNDSITGAGGADFLAGGAGGDTLSGSAGNDELVGSTGADRHLGQSGDDAIYAKNSDADTVNGGTNSDGTPDFDLAEIDTGIDVASLTASLKTRNLLAALEAANLEASDLLDSTYGGDEEDVGLIPGVNSGPDLNWRQITAAVVDSQGRTILVGYVSEPDGYDFVALRYDADGKWDQSFAGDGEAVINFDTDPGLGYGDDDFAYGVTVDADDNIIIVGSSAVDDGNGVQDSDFAICRLDETGALDTVFGTRRYDIVSEDPDIGGNGMDAAYDVVVQADDKIVVVGTSNQDIELGGGDVAVIRLDGLGSLDTSFNDGTGMNTLDVGNDEGVAVALQNLVGDDGAQRIVVGGSSDGDVLVARFAPDGELDTGFGGVGYVTDDLNELSFDVVNDIAVDANNDIVVVGQTTPSIITFAISPVPGSFTDGFVGKVAADGSESAYDFPGLPDDNSSYNAVAVDPETNTYVIVGSTGTDFILTRYTDGLVPDESLNGGVPVLTDFTPGEDAEWYDVALGVGVLEDGKIIAAGYSDTCGDGCIQTSVARYGIGQEIEEYIDFDDVQNDRGGNRSAAATFYLKSTHLDDNGNAFIELTNNNDVLTIDLLPGTAEDGTQQVRVTFGDLVMYYDTDTTSITIDGKNGNDVIIASNDVPIPLFIFGGNGTDQLAGGGAGDVIVGGQGNDTIGGNDGNDILIGGAASDAQNGGNGEDILVGGTTAYDDNRAALRSLAAEWNSASSNADRITHIRNGSGGLNGTNKLKVGSGATVFDDSAKDTYIGGNDRDWFFRRNSGGSGSRDVILDNLTGEEVTDF